MEIVKAGLILRRLWWFIPVSNALIVRFYYKRGFDDFIIELRR